MDCVVHGVAKSWTQLSDFHFSLLPKGFPSGASSKECRRRKRMGFDPWIGKIPQRRNGNPLQYSCLENPMDRGTWWATVQGGRKESDTTKVTQQALLPKEQECVAGSQKIIIYNGGHRTHPGTEPRTDFTNAWAVSRSAARVSTSQNNSYLTATSSPQPSKHQS